MNSTESFHNPVSLTIPDDSLTVKELFQRYQSGALERNKQSLLRQLEYDGWNPDIIGPDEPEDIIDKYDIAWVEPSGDDKPTDKLLEQPVDDKGDDLPVDVPESDGSGSAE